MVLWWKNRWKNIWFYELKLKKDKDADYKGVSKGELALI